MFDWVEYKWAIIAVIMIVVFLVVRSNSTGKSYCFMCGVRTKENCNECSNCVWRKGLVAGEGCTSNLFGTVSEN